VDLQQTIKDIVQEQLEGRPRPLDQHTSSQPTHWSWPDPQPSSLFWQGIALWLVVMWTIIAGEACLKCNGFLNHQLDRQLCYSMLFHAIPILKRDESTWDWTTLIATKQRDENPAPSARKALQQRLQRSISPKAGAMTQRPSSRCASPDAEAIGSVLDILAIKTP